MRQALPALPLDSSYETERSWWRRDHKFATVRLANAATGDVRVVMEETVETHFESVTGFEV